MARKSIYPPSVTPGIPRLVGKPEGWVETTFGEVLQVVQRRAEVADDTVYQLVNAKRNRGGVVSRGRLLGRQVLTKTQFLVRTDDFLISKRQIIHGACGIVPASLDGALVSNEYATLRVRDGLLLEYLRYFAHTVYFQQTCLHASVGVDVEKMIFRLSEWLKYTVHLPPIPEQQKIAAILGTWDEAIVLTEQRIAAGEQRKLGLMQRLLTGNVRLPEFAGQSWQEWRLQEIVRQITDGTHITPNYIAAGVPFVSTNNLVPFSGSFDFSTYQRFIALSEHDKLTRRCKPERGDLLVSKCGTIGRTQLIRSDSSFSIFVGLALIKLKEGTVVPEFLEQLLNSQTYQQRMQIAAPGGTRATLTIGGLQELRIQIPSNLDEQRRIAEVLAACDRELDLLARKRDALQRQKRGMMQQLLTGRVRVKGLDHGDAE